MALWQGDCSHFTELRLALANKAGKGHFNYPIIKRRTSEWCALLPIAKAPVFRVARQLRLVQKQSAFPSRFHWFLSATSVLRANQVCDEVQLESFTPLKTVYIYPVVGSSWFTPVLYNMILDFSQNREKYHHAA